MAKKDYYDVLGVKKKLRHTMCFQMRKREDFMISLDTQPLTEVWEKIQVNIQINGIRFPGKIPEDNDVESEITVSFTEAALSCEKLLKFDGARTDIFSVKIPAGIGEGQSIRLKGKGRTGYSGQKGDLFLNVHIKNDTHYTREGQDVYITQDVPYTTAILGGEAEFETLYGPVLCKVPAGSQAGKKLRLRNKGIVSMRDKNRYGDEYVILKISVPKQVSAQERELLQKLKDIEERKPA